MTSTNSQLVELGRGKLVLIEIQAHRANAKQTAGSDLKITAGRFCSASSAHFGSLSVSRTLTVPRPGRNSAEDDYEESDSQPRAAATRPPRVGRRSGNTSRKKSKRRGKKTNPIALPELNYWAIGGVGFLLATGLAFLNPAVASLYAVGIGFVGFLMIVGGAIFSLLIPFREDITCGCCVCSCHSIQSITSSAVSTKC